MYEPPKPSTKANSRQISFIAISDLVPAVHNPRKHSRAQIRAIARSIQAFGFNAPILVDRNRKIVADHGRYEAAKLIGLTQVPVVFLDHLTEVQAKAYMLADNKPTDRSTFDDAVPTPWLCTRRKLADSFRAPAAPTPPGGPRGCQ
jgi:ParB-like chromosome segregation protein Spo0J